ncbi:MAG: relaxase/mobilization nuclease domain-containing protein [Akkermansiaceae bacterium]
MVPRLAAEGSSFQGAWLYYCHDKRAMTSTRVAWTQTVNLITDRVEKAWKVMAYTAKVATQLKQAAGKKRAGDKVEKPVISYSLAWHPEQKPDKDTMLTAAKESIAKLGLSEHEAMIVAHKDEPQPHVHVVINRIHPLTGIAANMYRSKRKLQDWAREFQQKEKTMYCPQREKNYQKRLNGRNTKYVDPVIKEAWQNSQDAKGFVQRLEEHHYQLAQGRKRLVVVDAYGKTVNPVRHLEGVKAKGFHERMAGLDTRTLPTPEEIIKTRQLSHADSDKGISEPIRDTQDAQNESQVSEELKESPQEPLAEQPQQNAKLQEYEERVAAALRELGEQHYKEWKQTSDHHQHTIATKRTELMEHYKFEKRQNAIDTLQDKLEKPTLLPRFARKLFKIDQKLEDRIETLQEQQSRAKAHFDQSMMKLSKDRNNALDNLDTRHAENKKSFIKRVEKWRPSALSQEFDRSQKDHVHTHDQEKLNEPPGLEL